VAPRAQSPHLFPPSLRSLGLPTVRSSRSCLRRRVNHCPSLESGMSTILPQLRGSLLYSTKLGMKRRQVLTPGQQQHHQEMMQVVSNKMIPISIKEKVGSGFAAVECLLFGANRYLFIVVW
ncbi:unnamed protein product, partial [Musa hybrid cultivar]